MGADRPDESIELLDTGQAGEATDAVRVQVGGPRAPLSLVAVGLVAIGAWLVLGLTGRPQPDQAIAEPSPTSESIAPSVAYLPTAEPAGDPVEELSRVRMVVTSPTGEGGRLLTVDGPGEPTVVELPELATYAFDPSGRWLAGMGTGTLAERTRVLWAGPVEGPLEPLAVGVRSFAWHQDDSGVIGWSIAGGQEVAVATLDGSAPTRYLTSPVEGRLRGLGRWGLAIETSPRLFATAFVGHDGSVDAELPGRFRGVLAGGDVVLGGGAGPPLRYSPSTGEVDEIAWMGDDDDVWSLATDPSGTSTVAIVTRNGNLARPLSAEVVRIEGERAIVEGRLSALSPLGLGSGGEIVVVRQAGAGDRSVPAVAVVGAAGGAGVALPDLLPGPEWVAALSAT